MEFLTISIVVALVLLVLHIVMSKLSVNREARTLVIIIGLVGFVYWGIEPYAHHVMHPEPAPADYACADLKEVDTSLKGDAANGKALVEANCIACHSMTVAGHEPMMDNASAAAAYGVVPPDLSRAGRIYEPNYLANFIADPVKAANLMHKFGPDTGKSFPMPGFGWMGNQEIMDMVAYLQSVAPVAADTKESRKETFEAACVRCHDMSYAGIKAFSPVENVKAYLGATPPDLSMYIRSRGEHYLHNFINNPQRLLPGTSMPRVGLTEAAEQDVITYMEEVGDSKKAEREGLGPWVLLYMVIFAILAYLWKRQIWKEVH